MGEREMELEYTHLLANARDLVKTLDEHEANYKRLLELQADKGGKKDANNILDSRDAEPMLDDKITELKDKKASLLKDFKYHKNIIAKV